MLWTIEDKTFANPGHQPTCICSSLTRPNIISNAPNQLQLLHHIIIAQQITIFMTSETALRTYAQSLDGLLFRLAATFGHELGRFVYPGFHLLFVLELRELAGDHTEYHVLVFGEELQWLEAAGSRGVVLEVVRRDVKVVEELLGDYVVAAFLEWDWTSVGVVQRHAMNKTLGKLNIQLSPVHDA